MSGDPWEQIRTEAFRHDPYPTLQAFREAGPSIWDEASQTLELFGYTEVDAALRENRLSAARSDMFIMPEHQESFAALAESQRDMMLFADPPRHTRLRGLVNRAFTPRVVENMRSRIEVLVNEFLEAGEGARQMDVMSALALPLPVTVILELLGVPVSDRARLKQLSDAFAAFLGGAAREPEVLEAANSGIQELNVYFREVIARRRVEPGPDLISGLIAAEERGDVLSEAEMLATCTLVLVAGHETTTNLIGNGLLALLRHPEERTRFVSDTEILPPAIEELLRFDSPVQLTSRMVKESLELGGFRLEPGAWVDIWLGSANRDPAAFRDPDRLDLSRSEGRHFGFGYGIHFCVGAPLARLEGQIALKTIFERYPNLELRNEPLDYHDSLVFRSPRSLPVAW